MNKSHKRAIQKHRAKAAKFELRRKASGDQNSARPKTVAPVAAPARPRPAAKRRGGGDNDGE